MGRPLDIAIRKLRIAFEQRMDDELGTDPDPQFRTALTMNLRQPKSQWPTQHVIPVQPVVSPEPPPSVLREPQSLYRRFLGVFRRR